MGLVIWLEGQAGEYEAMQNATSDVGLERSFQPASALAGAVEAAPRPGEMAEEDVAAYLFDLLVGARRLATSRRQRFLAYLIGMALEEARLLMMGRSAADGSRKARP